MSTVGSNPTPSAVWASKYAARALTEIANTGEVSERVAAADVPIAVAPPPGNPRFPLFDGLRAIAALGVLVSHVGAVTHPSPSFLGDLQAQLAIGVTIFFVISGFLLYRPFVAADISGGREPTMRRFWRRRVLRIIPAYWVALTVLAFLQPLPAVFSSDWWKYYLLLQNNFGLSFNNSGIGQAWTLSVEVTFYLLLPFYAIALRRLGGTAANRRLAVEFVVLGLLALGSIGFRHQILNIIGAGFQGNSAANGFAKSYYDFFPDFGALLTLPVYLAWFAVGMGFAVISAAGHVPGSIGSKLSAVLGRSPNGLWLLSIVGFAAVLAFDRPLRLGEGSWHHVLVLAVVAPLVAPAVFAHKGGQRGVPKRVLSLRWLAWLGLVSYGIYLWHGSVTIMVMKTGLVPAGHGFIVALVVVCALTAAVAAASYYLVEKPILRFKEPHRKAQT